MSFEGYYEHLCPNGHYWTTDVYEEMYSGEAKCPHCKQESTWFHLVDETNGSDPNYPSTMPYPLEVEADDVYCECPTCGHLHIVERRRYKIPQ